MKKIILKPFLIFSQEMRVNKQIKEKMSYKGHNVSTFYPFMVMNYMFLIIYSILYLYLVYSLIVGIFIEPSIFIFAFIAVVMMAIFIWIFTLGHTKLYPKVRVNYLKMIGFYDNDGKNNKGNI